MFGIGNEEPNEEYPVSEPDDADPVSDSDDEDPSRMTDVPGYRSGCGDIFVNMFATSPRGYICK